MENIQNSLNKAQKEAIKGETSILTQYLVIGSVVGLLIYIGLYLGGAEMMTSSVAYLSILISIVIAAVACTAQKKRNGGFIEFPEALKISFGVMALSSFVVTIFSYFLMNYIDTDFKVATERETLIMVEKMMKRFGAPQTEIDKAMAEAAKKDNYSLSNMLLSFVLYCFFWFFVSLIVSSIVKKKKIFEGTPSSH